MHRVRFNSTANKEMDKFSIRASTLKLNSYFESYNS